MNNILETLIIVVIAVVGFTFIYKIIPFKTWTNKKPKFSLLPKYVAKLDRPVTDLEAALEKIQFKKSKNGVYTRGKVYGDFSAKAIKLAVEINKEKNQIKVYASFIGILFDTGDIWQVTSDIVNGQ